MDLDVNRCARNGRLVYAQEPIPDTPFDFVWPSGGARLGCSHLLCADCGEPVKNRPCWRLVGHLDRVGAARLYHAVDWTGLPELAEPTPANRAYVCLCGGHTEHIGRFLDNEGPEADFMPFRFRWACAGHPRLWPPFELDGERIAEDVDWDALLAGVVRDERALTRPKFTRLHPLGWAQRLYHLLEHTPLAVALGEAVGRLEGIGEPDLRAAAERFRRYLPKA